MFKNTNHLNALPTLVDNPERAIRGISLAKSWLFEIGKFKHFWSLTNQIMWEFNKIQIFQKEIIILVQL